MSLLLSSEEFHKRVMALTKNEHGIWVRRNASFGIMSGVGVWMCGRLSTTQ
jgi:hypothetical protein